MEIGASDILFREVNFEATGLDCECHYNFGENTASLFMFFNSESFSSLPGTSAQPFSNHWYQE